MCCEFGAALEEMLRDRLVQYVASKTSTFSDVF